MTATLAEGSQLQTRRGKLVLALLCAVAFLDFVDASIVNVALPAIRDDLGLLAAEAAVGAQWLPADLRRADAAGRPRWPTSWDVAGSCSPGTAAFGLASLVGRLRRVARAARGRPAWSRAAGAALSAARRAVDPHHHLHGAGRPPPGARGLGCRRGRRLRGRGAGGRCAHRSSRAGSWVMFVNPVLCALRRPAGAASSSSRTARGRGTAGFDVSGARAVDGRHAAARLHTGRGAGAGMGRPADRRSDWSDRGSAGSRCSSAVERAVQRPAAAAGGPPAPRAGRGERRPSSRCSPASSALFFFVTLYLQDVLGFGVARAPALAYVPSCLSAAAASAVGAQP